MGNGGQQSSLDPSSGNQGGNFTNGKGSRFAKFFDNKGRDPQMSTIQKPGGIPSPSQLQGHRQEITRALMEQQGGDSRAMEDLFAMLQSSSQVCSLEVLDQLFVDLNTHRALESTHQLKLS